MRAYERVLRRPQEEDRRRPPARRRQDGGGSRLRGEPLLGLKRYAKLAEEGRPLAPKKRAGLRPKLDGAAERLLEEDLEERPAATTLRQRRKFLRRAAGVSVSESAVSRAPRRLGFSRKKIVGSGRARRVPEGRLEGDGRPGNRSEVPRIRGRMRREPLSTSLYISLVALYAWSRRGERAPAKAPRNWGKNVTLLPSMSLYGL